MRLDFVVHVERRGFRASARYAVHEARWKDLVIRIFHHPKHATHPARMARSLQASLEYAGEERVNGARLRMTTPSPLY
jgi:hypothetical protein